MSVRWLRLLLLLGCLSVTGCYGGGEPETVLIGHLAPFSGRDKAVGEHAKQAITLAVEDSNATENQNPAKRIAVLHVDSRGDLDDLQNKAVRLIRINQVVALLGGQNAEEADRLGRASQTYGVAVVTPASLPGQPAGDNLFSVNASQELRGRILARFAAEVLKANHIMSLTESGRAGSEALIAGATKELATAVEIRREYKSDVEFKDAVERAVKAQPQAVLFVGPASDLLKLRVQLQQSGIKVPLLYGGDDVSALVSQTNEKTPSDVYVAEVFAGDGGTSQGQEFVKKYQERFHEFPDLQAVLAYDGIRLLAEAFRQTKSARTADVRAALAEPNFSFDSLTGPLTFAAEHSARRPLFIGKVQDGRVAVVKRYEPDKP
jgi:branched-chain amino acid transport system substrate-binding protein